MELSPKLPITNNPIQQTQSKEDIDDYIDTQSNTTTESSTPPKKTYSSVLTSNLSKKKYIKDDRSLTWCNSVTIILAKAYTLNFNTTV